MTMNLVQAFFGFVPLEVSIVGIFSLLAIGYLTIRLAGKSTTRLASDGSCANPNFYCICATCGKLRQLYRTVVKLHKKLNKMHDTLTTFKVRLRYPKPPPDKFPYLEKTIDLHQINNYERKLDKFHASLDSYHEKIRRVLDRIEKEQ